MSATTPGMAPPAIELFSDDEITHVDAIPMPRIRVEYITELGEVYSREIPFGNRESIPSFRNLAKGVALALISTHIRYMSSPQGR